MTDTRFELTDRGRLIGRYQTKAEALRVAVPGDSLFDRQAESGQIELWIVSGDMELKTLYAIRRKKGNRLIKFLDTASRALMLVATILVALIVIRIFL